MTSGVALLVIHGCFFGSEMVSILRRTANAVLRGLDGSNERLEAALWDARLKQYCTSCRACVHIAAMCILGQLLHLRWNQNAHSNLPIFSSMLAWVLHMAVSTNIVPLNRMTSRFLLLAMHVIMAIWLYGHRGDCQNELILTGIIVSVRFAVATLFVDLQTCVPGQALLSVVETWKAWNVDPLSVYVTLVQQLTISAFIVFLAGIMEFNDRSRIALLTNSESMVLSFRRVLRGVCDGEVLLDSKLQISGKAGCLQTLLMTPNSDFSNRKFDELLVEDERERFQGFVSQQAVASSISAPPCLRVSLKHSGTFSSSTFSRVGVDLFHVPLMVGEETYHLLALKQDSDACSVEVRTGRGGWNPTDLNNVRSKTRTKSRTSSQSSTSHVSDRSLLHICSELDEMTLLVDGTTDLLDVEQAHLSFSRRPHSDTMPNLRRLVQPTAWGSIHPQLLALAEGRNPADQGEVLRTKLRLQNERKDCVEAREDFRQESFVVGVADPTGALPQGQIFVSGLDARPSPSAGDPLPLRARRRRQAPTGGDPAAPEDGGGGARTTGDLEQLAQGLSIGRKVPARDSLLGRAVSVMDVSGVLMTSGVAVLMIHGCFFGSEMVSILRRTANAVLHGLDGSNERLEAALWDARLKQYHTSCRACVHIAAMCILGQLLHLRWNQNAHSSLPIFSSMLAWVLYMAINTNIVPLNQTTSRFLLLAMHVIMAIWLYGHRGDCQNELILTGIIVSVRFAIATLFVDLQTCVPCQALLSAMETWNAWRLDPLSIHVTLVQQLTISVFIVFLAGIMEFNDRSRIALLTNSESMVLSFRRVLRGVCDGEVLLDSKLQISGKAGCLQTLLMTPNSDFSNRKFDELLVEDERERFRFFVSRQAVASSISAPPCLRVSLKGTFSSSTFSRVSVDLFHVPLMVGEETYHLLALKQDSDACSVEVRTGRGGWNPTNLMNVRTKSRTRSRTSSKSSISHVSDRSLLHVCSELDEMTLLVDGTTDLLDVEQAHLSFSRRPHSDTMPNLRCMVQPTAWGSIHPQLLALAEGRNPADQGEVLRTKLRLQNERKDCVEARVEISVFNPHQASKMHSNLCLKLGNFKIKRSREPRFMMLNAPASPVAHQAWQSLQRRPFGELIFSQGDAHMALPELIAEGDLDGDLYWVCGLGDMDGWFMRG
eukprot:Skav217297  [mRNA]  locus=scaffold1466:172896:182887:+ [translate_table: standard]